MELTIDLDVSEPIRAGDSVTISCSARINQTLVDVSINVDMNLTQKIPPREITTITDDSAPHLYVRSVTYANISAQNSGLYVCNATVGPAEMNNFLSISRHNATLDLKLGK